MKKWDDYEDKQIKLAHGVFAGGLMATFFVPLGSVGLFLGCIGLIIAAGCGLWMGFNKLVFENSENEY